MPLYHRYRCPDLVYQVLRVKGLCNVTAYLHLTCLTLHLRIAESGYYQHRGLLFQLGTEEPDHLQATVIREVYINYHSIEIGLAKYIYGLAAVVYSKPVKPLSSRTTDMALRAS